MNATEFGKFIQSLRKEQGMTQAQLAEKLMVTDKAISRWERGVGFPDIQLLEPLAEALGVTVVELMRSERMMEESITVEEAGTIVTGSLRLAQEQERFKVRRRLLKWLGMPAVYLFEVGILLLVMRYVELPFWGRFLVLFVCSVFFTMVFRGIRYIADCRYLEEPKKINWPRQVTSCVSAIGFVVSIFALFLNTDGLREYYGPVTLLSWALMTVWPLYEVIRVCRKKHEEA